VGKQRTRAVASLEARMRVVASSEVSNSRECDGPMCWSYGPQGRTRRLRLNLFPTTPERDSARFAQLAMGCSNPTYISIPFRYTSPFPLFRASMLTRKDKASIVYSLWTSNSLTLPPQLLHLPPTPALLSSPPPSAEVPGVFLKRGCWKPPGAARHALTIVAV